MLGDGGDKVAGREDFKTTPDFGIHAGAVDDGAARGVGVHFFNGEGVANDVLREPLKISSLLWMDAETGVLPAKERSGSKRHSSTRKVMVRARNSSSTINVLLEDIELELEILQK